MYDIEKIQLMEVKVIGAEVREGDYQGNHFKNYILYTVANEKRKNELFGVCPSSVKIKSRWVEENKVDIENLNQHVVEIFYDSYGNVAKIDIKK